MKHIALMENINRKNLNPIDEANAYLAFYQQHDGMSKATAQDLINEIITHERSPGKAITGIIPVMIKIFGKSPSMLRKLITLTMAEKCIQEHIRAGRISMEKGIILAENRDHPKLAQIVERILTEKLTANQIRALFKEKEKPPQKRPTAYAVKQKQFDRWYGGIEKSLPKYSDQQIAELVERIENFIRMTKEFRNTQNPDAEA